MPNHKTEIKGILEIDHDRGVIYFHSEKTGTSILRICRLPSPIPRINGFNELDITHMHGCSWCKEDEKAPIIESDEAKYFWTGENL